MGIEQLDSYMQRLKTMQDDITKEVFNNTKYNDRSLHQKREIISSMFNTYIDYVHENSEKDTISLFKRLLNGEHHGRVPSIFLLSKAGINASKDFVDQQLQYFSEYHQRAVEHFQKNEKTGSAAHLKGFIKDFHTFLSVLTCIKEKSNIDEIIDDKRQKQIYKIVDGWSYLMHTHMKNHIGKVSEIEVSESQIDSIIKILEKIIKAPIDKSEVNFDNRLQTQQNDEDSNNNRKFSI